MPTGMCYGDEHPEEREKLHYPTFVTRDDFLSWINNKL